jgi:hypothetical protein
VKEVIGGTGISEYTLQAKDANGDTAMYLGTLLFEMTYFL